MKVVEHSISKKKKTQWVYMSISPSSGVRELERMPCFKHNRVLNWSWESTFTLGLKAAEIIDYIKKNASNESCVAFNFVQKTQWAYMSISLRSGARGSKDVLIWVLDPNLAEVQLYSAAQCAREKRGGRWTAFITKQ